MGVNARLSKRFVAMCPSVRPSHARQHQLEHVLGCRMNERERGELPSYCGVFQFFTLASTKIPCFRKREREDGGRALLLLLFFPPDGCRELLHYNNRTNVALGLRPLCLSVEHLCTAVPSVPGTPVSCVRYSSSKGVSDLMLF